MKKLARIISAITNPLLLSTPVTFIIVYSATRNAVYAVKWQLFTLLFFGCTAVFILYGIRKGFFKNFDVSKRKQRSVLFIFGIVITLFYLVSIFILQGPILLTLVVCMILIAILLFSVVNRRIKASFHIATACAIICSLVLIYGKMFYLLLLFLPLIAWSRVVLKRHTVKEVIAGGILGLLLSIITYIIGLLLISN